MTNNILSSYWADKKIAESSANIIVINDSKTLSGAAHVGSLRGPIVHDVLYRAAVRAHRAVRYLFGSDDYDPFDAVPPSVPTEFSKYLGMPLCNVPSPDGSDRSYSRFFEDEFFGVISELGITPEYYYMSDIYRSGDVNDTIQTLLDNAETVREQYYIASNAELPSNWYPFHVICENCGKIATTRVYDWDGQKVHYVCETDRVDYTNGCKHSGVISPYDGSGKLPWKMEWIAQWELFGVNLEGAGMDHNVAGGSRDVAEAVYRAVYEKNPPLNEPYEFLLIGKRKMSSSKGIGYSAREVANILPPELIRFLITRTRPRSTINFQIEDAAIPRLYDQYDATRNDYVSGKLDDVEKISFEQSQVDFPVSIEPMYFPRFTHVATVVQIPDVDVERHFATHKGSQLTVQETEELKKRIYYSKVWLDSVAPEDAVVRVKSSIPEIARKLSQIQMAFLSNLKTLFEQDKELSGEVIHRAIYDLIASDSIDKFQAFEAIYKAFTGTNKGPRAGELLSTLNNQFIVQRIQEVEMSQYVGTAKIHVVERRRDAAYRDIFRLNHAVLDKYPDLRIGVALIRGVTVSKASAELEQLKDDISSSLKEKYADTNLGELPRIKAYRDIYRGFGVDPKSRNPSAEALLRRITRGQGIYNINNVVDAYNITSAEAMIPMAAYDYDNVTTPVDLRFATDGEKHLAIGNKEVTILEAGELVYSDQEKVMCQDFNYRDSQYTMITPSTKNVLLFVDGCGVIPHEEVQTIVERTIARIIKFAGGEIDFQAYIYQDVEE